MTIASSKKETDMILMETDLFSGIIFNWKLNSNINSHTSQDLTDLIIVSLRIFWARCIPRNPRYEQRINASRKFVLSRRNVSRVSWIFNNLKYSTPENRALFISLGASRPEHTPIFATLIPLESVILIYDVRDEEIILGSLSILLSSFFVILSTS